LLDANTFIDENVSKYLNQNFINLKINAESEYGKTLFSDYNGTGYPLLIFLDPEKNELERFYGFLEPEPFLQKLMDIKNGDNTFPVLQAQYESGDNSAETMSILASKYAERGNDSVATLLYQNVILSKNVSSKMFFEAKYFISSQQLKDEKTSELENYINTYPDSPFLKDAVNKLIRYYQTKELTDNEISYFKKYIEIFSDDPWFLNQFSWRMTELDLNLDLALTKINHALNIIDQDANGIANIIDTKAEVLWKLEKIDEAIRAIEEAILLDPTNDYYLNQKEKFLQFNL
jgi:tetratricopeptide (TPR) repeat protein